MASAHGIVMLWASLEPCQALILQLDPDPNTTLAISGIHSYNTCWWPYPARPVEETLSSTSTQEDQQKRRRRLPKAAATASVRCWPARFLHHHDLSSEILPRASPSTHLLLKMTTVITYMEIPCMFCITIHTQSDSASHNPPEQHRDNSEFTIGPLYSA